MKIVENTWSPWIQGSPIHIWEKKFKSEKTTLKKWAKEKEEKDKRKKRELEKIMELNRRTMEDQEITPQLLIEEQKKFLEYQNLLRK